MTATGSPVIPAAEFEGRRRRLREKMAAAEIDVFVAYSDDRATFGQQHARYLFDYQPHFEAALSVVPLEGDEFIATGPEAEALVRATSHCHDVRVVDAFTHPDEEYPYLTIHKLSDALRSIRARGRSRRRIAIAGADALPKKLWDALAEAGAVELVDGERTILDLRAVKSPSEIAVIREAYRIAQAGTEAALAAVAPGVSEREIAAEAEHVMRRMGSEGMGIDTIVASGKDNTFAILSRTTRRRLGNGDHVLITLAPRYEGYHAAIGRVAAVGVVDERIEQAVAVAIRSQEAAAAALRAGAIGTELDRIARDVCREAGLEKYFAYSGIHSVGLVEFEAPILTSHSPAPLAANMVMSIDIPIFFAPWGGLRVEDGFLVTATGAEPLQSISKDLRRVN
jgi:Xaa-Pro aminopeptidase